ncbi:hypothetical protein C0995_011596 [Termitomyces sp. Mi166|nr:hypothetical protein C0995_011596 [Termitomyces sp. Mi166\
MDLVLHIADELILDKLWAKVVPLSAFANSYQSSLNSTFAIPVGNAASAWSQIVMHLPHPPISADELPSLFSAAASSSSMPQISAWPRDYLPRQLISLCAITLIGIHVLYFLFASLSYAFIFNHDMMRHPRFLKNQIKLEIQCSLRAFPVMMLLTLPWFQAEVMGYSRLYDGLDTYGYVYLVASVPLSYAVRFSRFPSSGWLPTIRAVPPFHLSLSSPSNVIPRALRPRQLLEYIRTFVPLIHDSDMITGHALEKVINGPAHHTLHHIYFTVNYGQYFTWADRVGNSYRQPESSLDPLLEVQALDKAKKQ